MADQPNIIFVITDQQRYDTINALGFPFVDTPHMDRLVREGVSFSNCHVAAPSCASSRASLFTGYFPHTTGILKNADAWRRSWVNQLADAGYHCVNVGKMHTWPFQTPCGFHERYVVENKDRYLEGRYYFDEWDKALAARGLVKQQRELYREYENYRDALGAFTWDLPEETHSDFFVGDFAQWWLRTKPVDKPLFLQIGFPGPHPPYDPVPRHLDAYADRELELQPVTETDLESQPPPFKAMRQHNVDVDHDSVVHSLNPTEEQRLRQRRHYLANVTMIDEKLGELMAGLEAKGILDNSIVMYMSGIKHGDYHTLTDIPVVLAGKGGGAISPGRHVRYPEPTPFPNLLLTLVNLMGVQRTELGDSTGMVDGISEPAGHPMTVKDDGTWRVTSDDGVEVFAKGLLLVSDDINDTNAYYLQLSDKSKLEIRVSFGVVHRLVFDAKVGRVVAIKGKWGTRDGRKVISSLEYQTP